MLPDRFTPSALTPWARRTLLVVLIVSLAGTAVAVSLTTLSPTALETFSSSTTDTALDVTTHDVNVQGKHQVMVEVRLTNTASTTAHGNVTVQLLDANETVIDARQLHLTDVAPGEDVSERLRFHQKGITDDYAETYIIVQELE